jgi:hypothetical protein
MQPPLVRGEVAVCRRASAESDLPKHRAPCQSTRWTGSPHFKASPALAQLPVATLKWRGEQGVASLTAVHSVAQTCAKCYYHSGGSVGKSCNHCGVESVIVTIPKLSKITTS